MQVKKKIKKIRHPNVTKDNRSSLLCHRISEFNLSILTPLYCRTQFTSMASRISGSSVNNLPDWLFNIISGKYNLTLQQKIKRWIEAVELKLGTIEQLKSKRNLNFCNLILSDNLCQSKNLFLKNIYDPKMI